jgi:molybdopterin-guanine dinucleotide biosynthesis protein A
MEPVLGAVLVGGASRRMGRDKALLPWHGEPLAVHGIRRLATVCPRVALVGGSGRGYDRLGFAWWPDPPGLAGAGPMAGLLAALDRAPRVLLVGCDLPELEPWFLRRLLAAGRGRPAAIPEVNGQLEPLCAVYGAELRPHIRRLLAAGRRKMADLLLARGTIRIPEGALGPPGEVAAQLRNLNAPDDLRSAEGDSAAARGSPPSGKTPGLDSGPSCE